MTNANDRSRRFTTAGGAPVVSNHDSMSAGPRGPLLLQDYRLGVIPICCLNNFIK